ncbi:MAG TPA: dinitrogenase iron-molybdenum cofactor [bacterium (Candidatus Stahlbacteria)]|nr:dinitrogenase iron-molybdenum cofactor [Candidatus Stahlbacteria bacterium]
MKAVISTDRGYVSTHFGRCPSFTIVEIENGVVLSIEEIDNPGHHPGFLPEFFSKMGINCIICGGMGRRAQSLFAEKGVATVLGVTGKVNEVVQQFAEGKLKQGKSLCQRASEKGHGKDKNECDHSQHE